ncbi:hypothetical protein RJ640_030610 [Escallonia rubra]|uniref:CCHC-type domain-containing protein n=1 Tax=Escallonia rubra TaxID=112253 RepID=A0AA88RLA9_9ASTE|nr:hypothetical protein RJ640_030610 [Escallonia rubra]
MYQLRMDEGSDLGDHISEFNRLVSHWSSIDVKLEEEEQAILLLSSLPKSYETLKTTLLIENETLLVDDVMLALMDSSRVNGMSSSSQGEGLVVRFENKNGHEKGRGRLRSKNSGHGKDMSKSRGKQDKSSIECWYCKEIDHIVRKCPKGNDKKNGKKHVNNANVAEENDKSSDGDLYLVSSVEQQEWNIVIGGASVSTHAGSNNDNSELWHKRLGHLSEKGKGSTFFTIKLMFGGHFYMRTHKVYDPCHVRYIDYCDEECMSMIELGKMCEEIGLEGYTKFYYKIYGKDLESGLVRVKTDSELVQMCPFIPEHIEIEMYLEEVSEEDMFYEYYETHLEGLEDVHGRTLVVIEELDDDGRVIPNDMTVGFYLGGGNNEMLSGSETVDDKANLGGSADMPSCSAIVGDRADEGGNAERPTGGDNVDVGGNAERPLGLETGGDNVDVGGNAERPLGLETEGHNVDVGGNAERPLDLETEGGNVDVGGNVERPLGLKT